MRSGEGRVVRIPAVRHLHDDVRPAVEARLYELVHQIEVLLSRYPGLAVAQIVRVLKRDKEREKERECVCVVWC